MIDISFRIGGRKVRPDQIGNMLERAMLESVRKQLVAKVGSIRDPETGAAPKLRVTGNKLSELKVEVEGSPALIAEVRMRLEDQ